MTGRQWDHLTTEARRVELRTLIMSPGQVEQMIVLNWDLLPYWVKHTLAAK